MPSRHTFTIKPIAELPTKFHLEAIQFLTQIPGLHKGCLLDPPYSPRQIKECYESIGIKNSFENTQSSFWSKAKESASHKIEVGGHVICFGWNTNGFGKKRGFELVEVLLVAHGGHHNDTIVTVERKFKNEINFSCGLTTDIKTTQNIDNQRVTTYPSGDNGRNQ